ncbi:MAG: hypothetical protein AAGA48_01485 [Myxococcota bacterium]
MTAQIMDSVILEDDLERYALVGISGKPLFKPEAHGLTPVMIHTACWRGWYVTYQVTHGQLTVLDLAVGLNEAQTALAEAGEGPLLEGRAPRKETYEAHVVGKEGPQTFDKTEWDYRNVGLPIPFSGGLLLGRDFIRELYVHMGFHPAWKYGTVIELLLREGHVEDVRDVSLLMAERRESVRNAPSPDRPPTRPELEAWIKRTFSRDYGLN